jgi:hypothetical protein
MKPIPKLSLRPGGKKLPPAAPAAPKSVATPTAAVSTPVTALPTAAVVVSAPASTAQQPDTRFDATQHALSCLASLSHDLARRSVASESRVEVLAGASGIRRIAKRAAANFANYCQRVQPIAEAPPASSFDTAPNKAASTAAPPALRALAVRSESLRRAASAIARSVVRTACAVGQINVRRRNRRQLKLKAKQQSSTAAPAVLTSMCGAAKREKRAKFKKTKKQQAQFDRRQLSRYFCLGCGLPRVDHFAGGAFSVVEPSASYLARRTAIRNRRKKAKAGTKSKVRRAVKQKAAVTARLARAAKQCQAPSGLIRCNLCALKQRALRMSRSMRVPRSCLRRGAAAASARLSSGLRAMRTQWNRGRGNTALTQPLVFRTSVRVPTAPSTDVDIVLRRRSAANNKKTAAAC